MKYNNESFMSVLEKKKGFLILGGVWEIFEIEEFVDVFF